MQKIVSLLHTKINNTSQNKQHNINNSRSKTSHRKTNCKVMDQGGVSLICSLLHKNLSVLEFGSGGSTTFFRFGLLEYHKFRLRANWWIFHLYQTLSVPASTWPAGLVWSMTSSGPGGWGVSWLGFPGGTRSGITIHKSYIIYVDNADNVDHVDNLYLSQKRNFWISMI